MMGVPLLSLHDLRAAYGAAQVLHGVNLEVRAGEAVSLMGRNGMGKSTTIKAALGLVQVTGGRVEVEGRAMRGLRSFRIARQGLGWVPEGRQIFSTLTVRENLVATARAHGPWNLRTIYALFPRLQERQANMGNQLSGGEQQMLAIARALMTNPQLLILDEATEGLAPLIREEIWQIIRQLRGQGQAILVVDKNLRVLAELCDRHVVLEKGRDAWQGDGAALRAQMETVARYLSV